MHRRRFVRHCTLLAAAAAGWSRFARGAVDSLEAPIDGGERSLILVELAGGCDGLNTVIPFRNDLYRARRPRLAVNPERVLRLDDEIGLHPAMSALQDLYLQGKLAVVNGVGYPAPDHTHFGSRRVWRTGSCNPRLTGHWTSRLDGIAGEESPAPRPKPQERSLALGSADCTAAGFYRSLKKGTEALSDEGAAGIFPVALGGFDTHSAQAEPGDPEAGVHPGLLRVFAEGLARLMRDLDRMGLGRQVLILAFSEFGRRLEENRLMGTEHGTANPVFVVGGAIRGGLYGAYPSLHVDDLDGIGDLRHTVDFRSIYATLLARWFHVDSTSVLGGDFPLLEFL